MVRKNVSSEKHRPGFPKVELAVGSDSAFTISHVWETYFFVVEGLFRRYKSNGTMLWNCALSTERLETIFEFGILTLELLGWNMSVAKCYHHAHSFLC